MDKRKVQIVWICGIWIWPLVFIGIIICEKLFHIDIFSNIFSDAMIAFIPVLFLFYHNLQQYHLGRRDFRPFSGDYVKTGIKNKEKHDASYPPIPESLVLGNSYRAVLKPGIKLGIEHRGSKVIGLPYDPDRSYHMIMYGAPGSGKSTGILTNCITDFMMAEKNHTGTVYQYFAIDIKNELGRLSVKNLKESDLAAVFNPTDYSSWGWDPLESIDPSTLGRQPSQDEILSCFRVIADALFICNDEKHRFFVESAKDVFIGLSLYMYEEGKDFIEICESILSNNVLELVKNTVDNLPSNSLALLYLANIANDDSPAIQSCISNLRLALQIFGVSENLKWHLHGNPKKIRLSEALKNGQSVFLAVEEKDLSLYAGFFRLAINQLFSACERRNTTSKQIIILLDELFRVGPIAKLQGSLATLRNRRVSCWMISQSASQLQELYGRAGALSIIENTRIRVILSCADPDSGRIYMSWAGEYDETQTSEQIKTAPFAVRQGTLSTAKRSKISGEDLSLLLKTDEQIIFVDGEYLRTDKIKYFDNRILRQWAYECMDSNGMVNPYVTRKGDNKVEEI